MAHPPVQRLVFARIGEADHATGEWAADVAGEWADDVARPAGACARRQPDPAELAAEVVAFA